MYYDGQYWKCPHCMKMQSGNQQVGNQNVPYMYPYGNYPMQSQCLGNMPGPMSGQGFIPRTGGMPGSETMPGAGRMPGLGTMPGSGTLQDSYPNMEFQPEPDSQTPEFYYHMYGYPSAYLDEQKNEWDMQKIKEMYPEAARNILQYVEEECDKMEHDGSIMFDEYPDRVMLLKITNDIYDKVKGNYELPEDEDKEDVFVMNKETRRRYPPKKDWLGDMIEVLLFQEMYRRRCRHRNCRKWY